MKKLAALTALALTALTSTASASAVTDVCEKQITHYVEARLGTTVTSMKFYFEDGEGGKGNANVWVRTPRCPGYYVFDLRASRLDCEIAHYGRIPNYIQRVWGTRGCTVD